MRRFPMVLAAALSSALVVLAVLTLDSVGAQGSGPQTASTNLTVRFANCMRDRGVDVPALRGPALERWLVVHRLPDADARACKTALAGVVEKPATDDARKLATCLRAQGLAAPTAPDELKPWIAGQDRATVDRALEACGAGPAPACGASKEESARTAERPKR